MLDIGNKYCLHHIEFTLHVEVSRCNIDCSWDFIRRDVFKMGFRLCALVFAK